MNQLGRILVLLGIGIATSAGYQVHAQGGDSEWRHELEKWRSNHAAGLTAPDGWLTVVALDWLKAGRNTVGTTEQDDIRLPGKDHLHYVVFELEKDDIWLRAPEGGIPSSVRVDGHQAQERAMILEGAHPTTVSVGTFSFFIIRRGDQFAVRVKDTNAEARLHFSGLNWYPPDPGYKIEATWIPFPELKKVNIQNAVGITTQGYVPGIARFQLHGQEVELEPFVSDANAKSMMFVLRDATSGKTTYPASRFLHVALPDHGLNAPGRIILDFNRLENPPCAFTAFATCPLPPAMNRLQIALEAGEERYGH